MKDTVQKGSQVFGRYLIEYRNEAGDLYFYKKQKINDFDEALKVKDQLEIAGFSDIRIVNRELL